MAEVLLLAENGVQVTTTRFVVGRDTYSIDAITSVAPRMVKPNTVGGAAVAIVALVVSPAALSSGSVALAVACLLVATLSAAYATTRKTTHVIAVATIGMPIEALSSTDILFAKRVLTTLKQSISMR